MTEQVTSKELVARLRDPKYTGQEMMREEAARAIEHWHGEFEVIQALFGGDNWRELTASQIHDRVSDLMLQLTQLQIKLKRYEPTDTYNGLTIEQWKARAETAEARLAHEPRDVIRARSFWSPDRRELITAYVSVDDISLMDDDGDIYGPAGDEQTHGPTLTKEVQHAVTCKLFPDPHDEREPVGPCTCGAEMKESAP